MSNREWRPITYFEIISSLMIWSVRLLIRFTFLVWLVENRYQHIIDGTRILLIMYVLYQIYRWWCKYSTKVSFFWDPSQGISLSGFPPKNRPTYAAFWGKFMIITVIFGVNMNTKAPKNPGRKLEWRHFICVDAVLHIHLI